MDFPIMSLLGVSNNDTSNFDQNNYYDLKNNTEHT